MESLVNSLINKTDVDLKFVKKMINEQEMKTDQAFIDCCVQYFIETRHNQMGYLYCLHNQVFNYYGADSYKVGCTQNLELRIKGYITCYAHPSIYMKTINIPYYELAECMLFDKLANYQITDNREFFRAKFDIIGKAFDELAHEIETEKISDLYTKYKVKYGPVQFLIKMCLKFIKYNRKLFAGFELVTEDLVLKKYYVGSKLLYDIPANEFMTSENLNNLACVLNYEKLQNRIKNDNNKVHYFIKLTNVLGIESNIMFNYDRDSLRYPEKVTDKKVFSVVPKIMLLYNIRTDKYSEFDLEGGYSRLYRLAITCARHLLGKAMIINSKKARKIARKVIHINRYYVNKDILDSAQKYIVNMRSNNYLKLL